MTSLQDVTAAIERVESVLRRRSEASLPDDAPATASWQGEARVVAAPGISPERLRVLVEERCRCSPIADAVQQATPLALQSDVD